MVTQITVRVYTGPGAGSESDAASGIDFISADNALNTLANRANFLLDRGKRSYEKWLRARVDVVPDNYAKDFKVWGDGLLQAETMMYYGLADSGFTPVMEPSSFAIGQFILLTSENKLLWDTAELVLEGDVTKCLVLQLFVGANAIPGNWTQETIYYEWTEA